MSPAVSDICHHHTYDVIISYTILFCQAIIAKYDIVVLPSINYAMRHKTFRGKAIQNHIISAASSGMIFLRTVKRSMPSRRRDSMLTPTLKYVS